MSTGRKTINLFFCLVISTVMVSCGGGKRGGKGLKVFGRSVQSVLGIPVISFVENQSALSTGQPQRRIFPSIRITNLTPSSTLRVFLNRECSGTPWKTTSVTGDYVDLTIDDLEEGERYRFYAYQQLEDQASGCAAASEEIVYDTYVPDPPRNLFMENPNKGYSNIKTPEIKAVGIEHNAVVQIFDDANCTREIPITNSRVIPTAEQLKNDRIIQIQLESEGEYTFYARQMDEGKNYSTCTQEGLVYFLDATPPDVPTNLSYVDPFATQSKDTSPVFGAGGFERGNIIEVFTDSNCAQRIYSKVTTGESVTFELRNLSEGHYNFYLRQKDTAGNLSACTTESLAYHVDLSVAPISSVLLQGNTPGNNKRPFVEVSSAEIESGSRIELFKAAGCNIADKVGHFNTSESGTQLLIRPAYDLDDGNYIFSAKQIDRVGNVSTCSTTNAAYTLDTVAPISPTGVSLVDPASSPGNKRSVVVNVIGLESDATAFIYEGSSCETQLSSGASTGNSANVTTPELSEGPHVFSVKQRDLAGNFSECSSSTVAYTLDITPPSAPSSLTMTVPASSPSNFKQIQVSIDGLEDGAKVELFDGANCELKVGEAISEGTSVSIQSDVLAEGAHTIKAKQTDIAGNISACSTVSIDYFLDSVPPAAPSSISLLLPASSPAQDTDATFRIDGIENGIDITLYKGASCEDVIVTQKSEGTSIDLTATNLAEGVHSFTATQTDIAGNISDCTGLAASYEVDLTPPTLPTDLALVLPEQSPGNISTPTLSISGLEVGATLELHTSANCDARVGVIEITDTTMQISSSELTEGTYEFYAQQIDKALNNSGCSSDSLSYELDLTVPEVPQSLAFVVPSSSPGNISEITIRVDGVEDGALVTLYHGDNCETSIGDQTATGDSANVQSSELAPGIYTLKAKQTDIAGNQSECSSASLIYDMDNIAPEEASSLALVAPASSPNNIDDVVVGVSGLEIGGSVSLFDGECSDAPLNTIPVESETEQIEIENLTEGIYEFRAVVTDYAGNSSPCSQASLEYELDLTSPPPSWIDLADGYNDNSNTKDIEVDVGDILADTKEVQVFADGLCTSLVGSAAPSGNPTRVSISLRDDKKYDLKAKFLDLAGNISECSEVSTSYVLDTVPPRVEILNSSLGRNPEYVTANYEAYAVEGLCENSVNISVEPQEVVKMPVTVRAWKNENPEDVLEQVVECSDINTYVAVFNFNDFQEESERQNISLYAEQYDIAGNLGSSDSEQEVLAGLDPNNLGRDLPYLLDTLLNEVKSTEADVQEAAYEALVEIDDTLAAITFDQINCEDFDTQSIKAACNKIKEQSFGPVFRPLKSLVMSVSPTHCKIGGVAEIEGLCNETMSFISSVTVPVIVPELPATPSLTSIQNEAAAILNMPPVIAPIEPIMVSEGEQVQIDFNDLFTNRDFDRDGETISYSNCRRLGDDQSCNDLNAVFNSESGVFQWTPRYQDIDGTTVEHTAYPAYITFSFNANDTKGNSTENQFVIIVRGPEADFSESFSNNALELGDHPKSWRQVAAGATYSQDVNDIYTGIDEDRAGQVITYTCSQTKANSERPGEDVKSDCSELINSATGEFSWTAPVDFSEQDSYYFYITGTTPDQAIDTKVIMLRSENENSQNPVDYASVASASITDILVPAYEELFATMYEYGMLDYMAPIFTLIYGDMEDLDDNLINATTIADMAYEDTSERLGSIPSDALFAELFSVKNEALTLMRDSAVAISENPENIQSELFNLGEFAIRRAGNVEGVATQTISDTQSYAANVVMSGSEIILEQTQAIDTAYSELSSALGETNTIDPVLSQIISIKNDGVTLISSVAASLLLDPQSVPDQFSALQQFAVQESDELSENIDESVETTRDYALAAGDEVVAALVEQAQLIDESFQALSDTMGQQPYDPVITQFLATKDDAVTTSYNFAANVASSPQSVEREAEDYSTFITDTSEDISDSIVETEQNIRDSLAASINETVPSIINESQFIDDAYNSFVDTLGETPTIDPVITQILALKNDGVTTVSGIAAGVIQDPDSFDNQYAALEAYLIQESDSLGENINESADLTVAYALNAGASGVAAALEQAQAIDDSYQALSDMIGPQPYDPVVTQLIAMKDDTVTSSYNLVSAIVQSPKSTEEELESYNEEVVANYEDVDAAVSETEQNYRDLTAGTLTDSANTIVEQTQMIDESYVALVDALEENPTVDPVVAQLLALKNDGVTTLSAIAAGYIQDPDSFDEQFDALEAYLLQESESLNENINESYTLTRDYALALGDSSVNAAMEQAQMIDGVFQTLSDMMGEQPYDPVIVQLLATKDEAVTTTYNLASGMVSDPDTAVEQAEDYSEYAISESGSIGETLEETEANLRELASTTVVETVDAVIAETQFIDEAYNSLVSELGEAPTVDPLIAQVLALKNDGVTTVSAIAAAYLQDPDSMDEQISALESYLSQEVESAGDNVNESYELTRDEVLTTGGEVVSSAQEQAQMIDAAYDELSTMMGEQPYDPIIVQLIALKDDAVTTTYNFASALVSDPESAEDLSGTYADYLSSEGDNISGASDEAEGNARTIASDTVSKSSAEIIAQTLFIDEAYDSLVTELGDAPTIDPLITQILALKNDGVTTLAAVVADHLVNPDNYADQYDAIQSYLLAQYAEFESNANESINLTRDYALSLGSGGVGAILEQAQAIESAFQAVSDLMGEQPYDPIIAQLLVTQENFVTESYNLAEALVNDPEESISELQAYRDFLVAESEAIEAAVLAAQAQLGQRSGELANEAVVIAAESSNALDENYDYVVREAGQEPPAHDFITGLIEIKNDFFQFLGENLVSLLQDPTNYGEELDNADVFIEESNNKIEENLNQAVAGATAAEECLGDEITFDAHGLGTPNSPYLICNGEQFRDLSSKPNAWTGFHFRQTQDINLGGYIGGLGDSNSIFFYDGGGHKITGLNMNRSSLSGVGLFDRALILKVKNLIVENPVVLGRSSVGTIFGGSGTETPDDGNIIFENVHVINGRIDAIGDKAGGLAAGSYTTVIKRSSFTGSINGSASNVGGLVGDSGATIIHNSFANTNISGTDYIGGLIGDQTGSLETAVQILNSYFSGSINSSGTHVGAMMGNYYPGPVNGVFSFFWNRDLADINSIGVNANNLQPVVGVYGVSNACMQNRSTFTNPQGSAECAENSGAAWDFVGEANNGTEDIWDINGGINGGYPYQIGFDTRSSRVAAAANEGDTDEAGEEGSNLFEELTSIQPPPVNLPTLSDIQEALENLYDAQELAATTVGDSFRSIGDQGFPNEAPIEDEGATDPVWAPVSGVVNEDTATIGNELESTVLDPGDANHQVYRNIAEDRSGELEDGVTTVLDNSETLVDALITDQKAAVAGTVNTVSGALNEGSNTVNDTYDEFSDNPLDSLIQEVIATKDVGIPLITDMLVGVINDPGAIDSALEESSELAFGLVERAPGAAMESIPATEGLVLSLITSVCGGPDAADDCAPLVSSLIAGSIDGICAGSSSSESCEELANSFTSYAVTQVAEACSTNESAGAAGIAGACVITAQSAYDDANEEAISESEQRCADNSDYNSCDQLLNQVGGDTLTALVSQGCESPNATDCPGYMYAMAMGFVPDYESILSDLEEDVYSAADDAEAETQALIVSVCGAQGASQECLGVVQTLITAGINEVCAEYGGSNDCNNLVESTVSDGLLAVAQACASSEESDPAGIAGACVIGAQTIVDNSINDAVIAIDGACANNSDEEDCAKMIESAQAGALTTLISIGCQSQDYNDCPGYATAVAMGLVTDTDGEIQTQVENAENAVVSIQGQVEDYIESICGPAGASEDCIFVVANMVTTAADGICSVDGKSQTCAEFIQNARSAAIDQLEQTCLVGTSNNDVEEGINDCSAEATAIVLGTVNGATVIADSSCANNSEYDNCEEYALNGYSDVLKSISSMTCQNEDYNNCPGYAQAVAMGLVTDTDGEIQNQIENAENAVVSIQGQVEDYIKSVCGPDGASEKCVTVVMNTITAAVDTICTNNGASSCEEYLTSTAQQAVGVLANACLSSADNTADAIVMDCASSAVSVVTNAISGAVVVADSACANNSEYQNCNELAEKGYADAIKNISNMVCENEDPTQCAGYAEAVAMGLITDTEGQVNALVGSVSNIAAEVSGTAAATATNVVDQVNGQIQAVCGATPTAEQCIATVSGIILSAVNGICANTGAADCNEFAQNQVTYATNTLGSVCRANPGSDVDDIANSCVLMAQQIVNDSINQATAIADTACANNSNYQNCDELAEKGYADAIRSIASTTCESEDPMDCPSYGTGVAGGEVAKAESTAAAVQSQVGAVVQDLSDQVQDYINSICGPGGASEECIGVVSAMAIGVVNATCVGQFSEECRSAADTKIAQAEYTLRYACRDVTGENGDGLVLPTGGGNAATHAAASCADIAASLVVRFVTDGVFQLNETCRNNSESTDCTDLAADLYQDASDAILSYCSGSVEGCPNYAQAVALGLVASARNTAENTAEDAEATATNVVNVATGIVTAAVDELTQETIPNNQEQAEDTIDATHGDADRTAGESCEGDSAGDCEDYGVNNANAVYFLATSTANQAYFTAEGIANATVATVNATVNATMTDICGGSTYTHCVNWGMATATTWVNFVVGTYEDTYATAMATVNSTVNTVHTTVGAYCDGDEVTDCQGYTTDYVNTVVANTLGTVFDLCEGQDANDCVTYATNLYYTYTAFALDTANSTVATATALANSTVATATALVNSTIGTVNTTVGDYCDGDEVTDCQGYTTDYVNGVVSNTLRTVYGLCGNSNQNECVAYATNLVNSYYGLAVNTANETVATASGIAFGAVGTAFSAVSNAMIQYCGSTNYVTCAINLANTAMLTACGSTNFITCAYNIVDIPVGIADGTVGPYCDGDQATDCQGYLVDYANGWVNTATRTVYGLCGNSNQNECVAYATDLAYDYYDLAMGYYSTAYNLAMSAPGTALGLANSTVGPYCDGNEATDCQGYLTDYATGLVATASAIAYGAIDTVNAQIASATRTIYGLCGNQYSNQCVNYVTNIAYGYYETALGLANTATALALAAPGIATGIANSTVGPYCDGNEVTDCQGYVTDVALGLAGTAAALAYGAIDTANAQISSVTRTIYGLCGNPNSNQCVNYVTNLAYNYYELALDLVDAGTAIALAAPGIATGIANSTVGPYCDGNQATDCQGYLVGVAGDLAATATSTVYGLCGNSKRNECADMVTDLAYTYYEFALSYPFTLLAGVQNTYCQGNCVTYATNLANAGVGIVTNLIYNNNLCRGYGAGGNCITYAVTYAGEWVDFVNDTVDNVNDIADDADTIVYNYLDIVLDTVNDRIATTCGTGGANSCVSTVTGLADTYTELVLYYYRGSVDLALSLVWAVGCMQRQGIQHPNCDPTRFLSSDNPIALIDKVPTRNKTYASYRTDIAASRVAIIDSGLNPYHEYFYSDGPLYKGRKPSAVDETVLKDFNISDNCILNLTRTGNFEMDYKEDKEAWEYAQQFCDVVWFKGTNIIAKSFEEFTPNPDGPQQYLMPNNAEDSHGLSVVAAAASAAPEAMIFYAEGANRTAEEWIMTNQKIDIVSTSYGPMSGISTSHIAKSFTGVSEYGKLHFGACSNTPSIAGAEGNCGPWWTISVSGLKDIEDQNYSLTSFTPDIAAADNQILPTCADCQRGSYDVVTGTSFATPRAAATMARVLGAIRQRIGDEKPFAEDRYGSAIAKGMFDDKNINITNWELRRVFEIVANTPSDSTIPDNIHWANHGWGIIDPFEDDIIEASLTQLGLNESHRKVDIKEKSTDHCDFQENNITARKTYWDKIATNSQTYKLDYGDDPFRHCRESSSIDEIALAGIIPITLQDVESYLNGLQAGIQDEELLVPLKYENIIAQNSLSDDNSMMKADSKQRIERTPASVPHKEKETTSPSSEQAKPDKSSDENEILVRFNESGTFVIPEDVKSIKLLIRNQDLARNEHLEAVLPVSKGQRVLVEFDNQEMDNQLMRSSTAVYLSDELMILTQNHYIVTDSCATSLDGDISPLRVNDVKCDQLLLGPGVSSFLSLESPEDNIYVDELVDKYNIQTSDELDIEDESRVILYYMKKQK